MAQRGHNYGPFARGQPLSKLSKLSYALGCYSKGTNMIALCVLAFCRIVTALIFAMSFGSKILALSAFERSIAQFAILPPRLSQTAARSLLVIELLIVLMIVIGGPLLLSGFVLAIGLLLIFSGALALVLARGVKTSCNCFGPSENLVSPHDIWRNVGLIVCAFGGCGATVISQSTQSSLGMTDWILIGPAAIIYGVAWTQLGGIVQLFQQR